MAASARVIETSPIKLNKQTQRKGRNWGNTFKATMCGNAEGLWAVDVTRKRWNEGSGKTDRQEVDLCVATSKLSCVWVSSSLSVCTRLTYDTKCSQGGSKIIFHIEPFPSSLDDLLEGSNTTITDRRSVGRIYAKFHRAELTCAGDIHGWRACSIQLSEMIQLTRSSNFCLK
jgi:hypothetical protein